MATYLTLCQIIVFAYRLAKKQISLRLRKTGDILLPMNLSCFMSMSVVLAGAFSVQVLLVKTLIYFVDHTPLFYSAAAVPTVSALTAIYLALWIRQISFYTEPAIKHLTHSAVRFFSYFEGVLICTTGVAYSAIIAYFVHVKACRDADCVPKWVSGVVIGTQLQIQFALLILFVLPLLKHNRRVRTATGTERPHLAGHVKRAIAATATSIMVDVATTVIYLRTGSGLSLNLLVVLNLICVIACFADAKERFLPCFLSSDEDQVKSRSNTLNMSASGTSAVV